MQGGGDLFDIVGVNEGFGYWRSPGVQRLVGGPITSIPLCILRDLIEVCVVLGEVAGRVAEVPEQVAAEEVTAEAPDVAAGVDREQGLSTPTDFVDVVDLPRRVVEERDGSIDEPDVVMVGAARRNAIMPALVSLSLKPRTSVRNRMLASKSGLVYST